MNNAHTCGTFVLNQFGVGIVDILEAGKDSEAQVVELLTQVPCERTFTASDQNCLAMSGDLKRRKSFGNLEINYAPHASVVVSRNRLQSVHDHDSLLIKFF